MNKKTLKQLNVYTDGSCKPNPGPGGWGVFVDGDQPMEFCGCELHTTNNRMEMMAAIAALENIEGDYVIHLYTDSQYLKKGIRDWIKGWKRNGWKTITGKPVKNKDLWVRLDALTQKHWVKWHWVKGHSGVFGNEVADRLAARAHSLI